MENISWTDHVRKWGSIRCS